MKLIYRHENPAIIHSVKNVLERNGIACFLKNEHSASIGGALGLTNTEAQLWLRNSGDYEQASSIVESEILDASSKSPWICANCDEENAGSFEICWKCQHEPVDS